jgi:outer membrane cobalamin receptor
VVEASYTRLDTEVLDPGLASDAGFVEGEPLLRRPPHSGSLAGRADLAGGSVGLSLKVVGEREDLDFSVVPASRVTLPAHTTVGLSAEHALPLGAAPATDLLLQVENLLDADYHAIAGFPAAGRVARLGFRMRF